MHVSDEVGRIDNCRALARQLLLSTLLDVSDNVLFTFKAV